MTKQKTRQELERKNSKLRYLLAVCAFTTLVFILSYIILGIIEGIRFNKLETQLSECQEQVDVWELEVKCEYDSSINYYGVETRGINVTEEQFLYLEFSSYEDYQEMVDEIKQDENCEIIE